MGKRKKFGGKWFTILGMPRIRKEIKPIIARYKTQGYKYFRTTKSPTEVGGYYIYTNIWGRKTK